MTTSYEHSFVPGLERLNAVAMAPGICADLRGGSQPSKSCRVAIGNCPTLEWKPFRDPNETIGNHLESIHIIYMCVCLFIYLLVYLFIYMFIYLFICLFIYMFVYLFIYMFIYLFMCVCVSPFENHHFALGLEAPFFSPWTAPMSFTKLWISMASCSLSRCPGRRPLETAGFFLERSTKKLSQVSFYLYDIYIYDIYIYMIYIYISMHM